MKDKNTRYRKSTRLDGRRFEASDAQEAPSIIGSAISAVKRVMKPYGKAKPLAKEEIEQVIEHIWRHSAVPESDALKVELSFFAGLRSAEIAQLTIADVTDGAGRLARVISVPARISKSKEGREIPMHIRVERALRAYRNQHPTENRLAISARGNRTSSQSPAAVTMFFHRLYRAAGLKGCSSHSGRRTFITELARRAANHRSSLADVQRVAGHARLDTTGSYMAPSTNMGDLINSLGNDASRDERLRKGGR